MRGGTYAIVLLLLVGVSGAQWYIQTELGAVGLQGGEHKTSSSIDPGPVRLAAELPAIGLGRRIAGEFGAAVSWRLAEFLTPIGQRHAIQRAMPFYACLTYGLTPDRPPVMPYVLAFAGVGFENSFYDSGEPFARAGLRAEWPLWKVFNVGAEVDYSGIGLSGTASFRVGKWWMVGR